MTALAKLLLISSLFVLVFAQITTWPAMRTNAVLTRVLAAEYPSPGDSQRPQGITRMGNNYFTIWKGDSRIFKRPVISPSGASQIPEITVCLDLETKLIIKMLAHAEFSLTFLPPDCLYVPYGHLLSMNKCICSWTGQAPQLQSTLLTT